METVNFLGFDNCIRMFNDQVDLIVATEVGPRILRYGPIGGANLMGEFPDNSLTTDLGEWNAYGGHRLWVAPESMPHSYAPDNEKVEARMEGNFAVRVTQPFNAAHIEKEMLIELDPGSSHVRILHKLVNRSHGTVELAPWALTVLSGGSAIVPLEPFRSHDDALLPSQPLVLWPFTDLEDPRIKFSNRRLIVTCDGTNPEPQKLGLANKRQWAAYHKGDVLFVKRFGYSAGAIYPDYGSNNEIYVAGDYLEIESLGPLVRLEKGQSVYHEEKWELHTGVSASTLEPVLQGL